MQKAIASSFMHELADFFIVWQKLSDAVSTAQHLGAVTVTLAKAEASLTSTKEPVAFMTYPNGGEPQVTLAADSSSVMVCISVKLLQPTEGAAATVVFWKTQYSGLIRLQKSRTALVLEKTPVGQVLHFGPHFWATVNPSTTSPKTVAEAQSAASHQVELTLWQFDSVVICEQDLYAQTLV